tara:strand:- start:1816 stop:2586 length:771 start_codon:yes stop_codon:yes gene_type:complete
MNTWSWNKSFGNYFLESDLLKENGFQHGFFSIKSLSSQPELLSKSLGEGLLVLQCKQIHSSNVVNIKGKVHYTYLEADGLCATQRNQSLWVYTADCIPLLIADRKKGYVASVHVGWRGIAKGIINNAINRLKENGSSKNDLIAAIGPAISKFNYDVDISTLISIHEGIKDSNRILKAQEKIEYLESLKIVEKRLNSDKFFLDIRLAAVQQLKLSGLDINQIAANKNCTFNEENHFHSWRRSNKKKYQWSGIMTKEV